MITICAVFLLFKDDIQYSSMIVRYRLFVPFQDEIVNEAASPKAIMLKLTLCNLDIHILTIKSNYTSFEALNR